MNFQYILACSINAFAPTLVPSELLFDHSDFEKGTLLNWTAEGDAFELQPTKGDNPAARGRERSRHQGQHWSGTYEDYNGSIEFRLTPGTPASGYPETGYDQPLRPQFHFTSRRN